jgi:type 1 fimbriae regulatory protein FimB/type 1 fimbriae regulatory protein FimE
MAKAQLKLVSPAANMRTVMPTRKPNSAYRTREHLTANEVDRLLTALRKNRHGQRDALMGLMMFRHGLRVSELIDLRWEDVDYTSSTLHVRRLKNSDDSTQPIDGQELRGLRALQREQAPKSPFIFTSERGSPFARAGVGKMIERAGETAKIGFQVHAHMLRHACGHVLASKGTDTRTLQAYLGHRNIQHTVRYTKLSPGAFKNLWR